MMIAKIQKTPSKIPSPFAIFIVGATLILAVVLPVNFAVSETVPNSGLKQGAPGVPAQAESAAGVANKYYSEDNDEFGDVVEDDEGMESEMVAISDPLQPWNRMWYHFNDKLYFWMLKPMAQGYGFVVPEGFRISFSNFYTNASAPVRIFNSLFQLKVNRAFTELGRFLINTTVGFVGMRDCAKDCFGIKPHDEDFGQTLGHYGLGHGCYLVWPFFGPSSVRDSLGKGGDSFLSFTGMLGPIDLEFPVWAGIKVHEVTNEVSFRIGDYEAIKAASIDPYIAIRNGYAQRRKKAVEE